MSGLIQRLLDRGGPSLSSVPTGVSKAASATRSQSPMAEHDQRLQDPGFRGLMDLTPVLPSEPMHDAPSPELNVPTPKVQRPARQPAVRRRLKQAPIAVPPTPQNTDSKSIGDPTPAPVFDPIAALRGSAKPQGTAADKEPPTVRPQKTEAPPSIPPARSEVVSEKEVPTATPQVEKSPSFDSETPRPAIIDRLPTDPPNIEALPPVPPMPEPLPLIARPNEPAPRIADVSPATAAPSVEVAAPDVQPVRPAAPRTAVEQITAPEVAPAQAQNGRERINERVVREVHTEPAPEPQQPRQRVSANSVSRIGALPERRRAFTIFGLRRG